MRPLGVALAIVVLAGVLGHSAGSAVNRTAGVTVAKVTDGDTIALGDGRRIRLLQIDAPELGTGECYSRASRSALLRLVPVGSSITLEADRSLDNADSYGRLLRYIHRQGANINLELVRQGAAAPYFYRAVRGRYAAPLLAAARTAKASKRGLWKACAKTPLNPDKAIETGVSGPSPTAPTPPASTSPNTPPAAPTKCHSSYEGACLDPNASDYDCLGGSGNGPLYTGPVKVVGPDVFRLDSDGDGLGCEDS